MEACPVDAISKRTDGIVVIDEENCIGCGECIEVCPFSVIGIDPHKEVAQKCNLCVHRVEKGIEPACVTVCEANAIHFGDINEIAINRRQNRV